MKNIYSLFDQIGFRTGLSEIDHLKTIDKVVIMIEEYNNTLYLTEKLLIAVLLIYLKSLIQADIEHKYIRTIGNIYVQNTF